MARHSDRAIAVSTRPTASFECPRRGPLEILQIARQRQPRRQRMPQRKATLSPDNATQKRRPTPRLWTSCREDAETRAAREQLQCLDPLNLHSLPDGLTSAEFRPLWLAILELIHKDQARAPRDSVAAGQDDPSMARLLSPKLEQRARTVAAQLSHREIAYAVTGLQLALMQAADTMTLILEERLQYEDTRREAEEEAPEQEPRPREESEEEVPVDEAEEETDGTALVQRPPRQNKTVDPLWKALSGEEKRRLQESILALLPNQADPEPSFTLLAMTGASPSGCRSSANNLANIRVAVGELRPMVAHITAEQPAGDHPDGAWTPRSGPPRSGSDASRGPRTPRNGRTAARVRARGGAPKALARHFRRGSGGSGRDLPHRHPQRAGHVGGPYLLLALAKCAQPTPSWMPCPQQCRSGTWRL